MQRHHFSRLIFSLLLIFLFLFQFACTSTGTSTNNSDNASQSQIAISVSTDNTSQPSPVSVAPSENATIAGEKASDNQSNTAVITYKKPTRFDYQGSIMAGTRREYVVHIPRSYDGTKAVPLVLVFHGYAMDPKTIADASGFNVVSDSDGFVVVYPTGILTYWHFNLEQGELNIDDVGFVSSLIDKLLKELNINAKMVYATGLSAGAGMSHSLACQLSDKIAAVALVAAPFSKEMEDHYKPLRPVPVMIIHGTDDPVCNFAGGQIGLQGATGITVPVRELVNYWIGYDGCSPTPKITELPDAEDGTKVQIEEYTSGPDNPEVIFYMVKNGGHTWPGGKQYMPTEWVGNTSQTFDASQVIWQFFYEHPMK
jgi:polyhydroxybutyrate depolymerase